MAETLIAAELCGGPLDGTDINVQVRKDAFPPPTLRLINYETKRDEETGLDCPVGDYCVYALMYFIFRGEKFGVYVWDGIYGDQKEVDGRIFRILRRLGVSNIDDSKCILAQRDIPKRQFAKLRTDPTIFNTWKCTAIDNFGDEICSLEYTDKMLLEVAVSEMAQRELRKLQTT